MSAGALIPAAAQSLARRAAGHRRTRATGLAQPVQLERLRAASRGSVSTASQIAAQSVRWCACQCSSRLRTSAGLRWQYACSRAYVAMYSRNRSSGSWPDAQRAPVGGGVDQPGAGQRLDPRSASARPSPPGRRPRRTAASASGSPAVHSRPERIAWRAARSPTNRGRRRLDAPGMIPSLRAGRYSREPRVAITWSITCSSWQAPPIANLSTAAIHSFSIGPVRAWPTAAVELVDIAEVADQVEEEVDLAVVEVGEVDARAEYALAGVAGVVDRRRRASRPTSIAGSSRIRSTAPLGRAERGAVLGVEVAGVAQLEDPRPAAAGDADRAEVDDAGRAEAAPAARAPRASAASIASTQVPARPAARRARSAEQQALGQLDALLVGELALALGVHLGARRGQAGNARRRRRRRARSSRTRLRAPSVSSS